MPFSHDDTFRPQCGDLVGPDAQLAEHLVGVLTEVGSGGRVPAFFVEQDRRDRQADRPGGVLDRSQEAISQRLGIVEDLTGC
jgi:hypothetical protein